METCAKTRLDPTRPLCASWPGGKFRLAKTIIPLIPEHDCYCEPFAGAAWILFKKPPSRVEILNDINNDLVNLYRVVREKPDALMEKFSLALKSRQEFEYLKNMDASGLDDVERAYRFFYVFSLAFGGKLNPPFFCIRSDKPWGHFNFRTIQDRLALAHARLVNVNFECLDFGKFIVRYDRPQAFFYCDPPYVGTENYYGRDFYTMADLIRLAEILGRIQGKFLLSINDCDYARELFAGFNMRKVSVSYSINMDRPGDGAELLISNYDMPDLPAR